MEEEGAKFILLWAVVVCFLVIIVASAAYDNSGPEREPIPSAVKVMPMVEGQNAKNKEEIYEFDLTKSLTIGNTTCLYINRHVSADKMARLTMNLKRAFEKAHPELEITSWKIEHEQFGEGSGQFYCLGLFLDHRPR